MAGSVAFEPALFQPLQVRQGNVCGLLAMVGNLLQSELGGNVTAEPVVAGQGAFALRIYASGNITTEYHKRRHLLYAK
jgi:hypothetical protein